MSWAPPKHSTMSAGLAAFDQRITDFGDPPGMSLRDFHRESWHVLEPGVPYLSSWVTDAISDHLEAVAAGGIEVLSVSVPPRSGKSGLTSVAFPAWAWGPGAHPEWKFISATYAQPLATRDNIRTRQLIQSPWYMSRWGRWVSIAEGQSRQTKFSLTGGGQRLATAVGAMATGEGAHVIVCDDLLKARDAYSSAKREAAISFLRNDLSTRWDNPKKRKLVLIMQRLHESDPVGVLMAEGNVVSLVIPQVYDPQVFISLPATLPNPLDYADPRTEEGELMWPERFPRSVVDQYRRELGSYNFAAQEQQTPTPPAGGILKKTWIRWYTPGNIPPGCTYFQSWDLAFKGGVGSYVVGQVWAQARNGDLYLVFQVRGRWGFTDSLREIVALSSQYQTAETKLVEAKANGEAVLDILKNDITSLIGDETDAQILTGFLPVNVQDSKEGRAHAISPHMEMGRVHFPGTADNPPDWLRPLLAEFSFPYSEFDDCIDTLTQAVHHALGDTYTEGSWEL